MVDAFILPFIRVPPQNKSLIIKGKNLKSVHDDDDIEKNISLHRATTRKQR